MKKIILIFFLILNLYALNLNQTDKKEHLMASGIISAMGDEIYSQYYYNRYKVYPSKLKRYIVSISTGILAGFAKEMYDKTKHNNHFDNQDFKADILGSILGSLIKIEIKW